MLEELLRIENAVIVKDGQELIKRLDLQVYKGEILGLISDNIREKQCILEILGGNVELDSGWVFYDEKRVQDYEVSQTFKNKIAVIDAKSKLVSNLSVAENIFVVRGGFKKYFIHNKLLDQQAGGLLADFKLEIKPDQYAGRLTPLERCSVELLKAYATGHRVIVCSDLSSFLSSTQVRKVIQLILWLTKKGIGFIMIENYDEILFDYSDRMAVIHNGKTVRIFDGEDMDINTVYSLLMGEAKEDRKEPEINKYAAPLLHSPPVFEIKEVFSDQLSDLFLQIHPGEIVNVLYQEEECGQELLSLLTGEKRYISGEMRLEAKRYAPAGLWDAIKKGVCFIGEDPVNSMLFYDMSVMDNLIFTMSNKVRGLWFHTKYRKSIRKHLEPIFGKEILHKQMSKLEPVTLQQLAYSKWLLYLPKLIILRKPFSAVDVHMRQVTKQLINTFTSKGIAVLLLTSNTSEAHTMGGRILQLRGGLLREDIS